MPTETVQSSNPNDFIDNLITSYESRIKNIGVIFNQSDSITESSLELLRNFSNSLKDYKNERITINSRLRENLAKNGSLRKKDYNRMMEDILNKLDEKEEEAENLFSQFIDEQRTLTQSLKKGILEIKDNLRNDNSEKISLFRRELSQISQKLETKKTMVVKQFIDYQQVHRRTIGKFKMLLAKGDQIIVRDVKEIHRILLNEIA